MRKENKQGQAHIFQDTYFESSEIHQLAIMYHFELTNHDIILTFLVRDPYKFFLGSWNQRQ